MFDNVAAQPLATFCGTCNDCNCPQLYVDESAPADQRIVLTDDFGSRVRMSTDQFADMIAQAKSGALDSVI